MLFSNLFISSFFVSFLLFFFMSNTKRTITCDSEALVPTSSGDDKKHMSLYKERPMLKTIGQLDHLTGLCNGDYFRQQLNAIDTKKSDCIVVYIGISGLKLINESFGFEQGDEVLQEIAIVLKDVFYDDIVSRLKGSNFSVLITNKTDECVEKKAKDFIKACTNKSGFIMSAFYGIGDCKALTKEQMDIFIAAKENMYLNKSQFLVANQSEIAFALHRNLSVNYPKISDHLKRCSDMSCDFGLFLNLPPDVIEDLKNCALLHDIAITMIPRIIVYKADFPNDMEGKIYKNHVMKGFDIAIESGMNHKVATGILHHHENYNGSGYPLSLDRDRIPFISQVVAIVDCVDMTIFYSKLTDQVEKILLSKVGIEFSEELVYNMIDFLKNQEII